MARGIIFIGALVAVYILTPLSVQAETTPCVVDESGYYVSGSDVGKADEDLSGSKSSVYSKVESTDSGISVKELLISVLETLSSKLFVTIIAIVCVIVAAVGIISLGGNNYSVRQSKGRC